MLMLQYRAAAVAGFATQCWWGIIRVMIFAAFFRSSRAHQPLDLAQAVTYTWLAQAFLVMLPWYADPDVTAMVRSGDVSYDRMRPLDTYFYWYARSIAWTLARVIPRAAMMFALAALIIPLLGLGAWSMRMPGGIGPALMFAPAMLSVLMLSSAMTMLINVAVVTTMTDRGANSVAAAVVTLMSGSILPLQFFPDWMQRFLFLQPCSGLLDIPNRIYMGSMTGAAAVAGLIQQLFWIVTLMLVGRMLLGRAMSRLQVQGG